jgi:hypothetical protein
VVAVVFQRIFRAEMYQNDVKKLFLKCKIYIKKKLFIKKINFFRNNKQNKSLIFTLNNFKTFNKNKGLNKRFKKKNYSQVVTLFL